MTRLIILLLMLSPTAGYGFENDPIPHVGRKAQDSFQFDYRYATDHKAFAIAPGGAWSWVAAKPSPEAARKSALAACARYTRQQCMIYALDKQVVLDKQEWFASWGPYKSSAEAARAETGTGIGQKFPNLLFTSPDGKRQSLGDLRGKVVFVHFWGCWCPSCRYEFQTLIDMYRIVNDTIGEQMEFVVLQVREPISTAREWAKENNVAALPLSDSGVQSAKDKWLTLKGGEKIPDRSLASAFPATYVLDKNGLVVFSHMGSVTDWSEYVPFFKDVAKRSKN